MDRGVCTLRLLLLPRPVTDDEESMFALRQKRLVEKANITHVLSVLRTEKDSLFEGFHHHVVPVDDIDDEDLLQYFPSTNAFISEALRLGGVVFVHWYYMKSYSLKMKF